MEGQNSTSEKRRRFRWEKPFLDSLRVTGNVSSAARAVGIDRKLAYILRKQSQDFAKEWDDAIEESIDLLEKEAHRRAVEGLVRYKFDKNGDPITFPGTDEPYYELDYSDTLLIFLLKGGRPHKFRDKTVNVNANVSVDVNIAIREQLRRKPADELVRLHHQTLGVAGKNQHA